DGRKKRDFIPVLQHIVTVLILHAHGDQRRFPHGHQLRKTGYEPSVKLIDGAAFRQRLRNPSCPGEVLEVRVKADVHVHRSFPDWSDRVSPKPVLTEKQTPAARSTPGAFPE